MATDAPRSAHGSDHGSETACVARSVQLSKQCLIGHLGGRLCWVRPSNTSQLNILPSRFRPIGPSVAPIGTCLRSCGNYVPGYGWIPLPCRHRPDLPSPGYGEARQARWEFGNNCWPCQLRECKRSGFRAVRERRVTRGMLFPEDRLWTVGLDEPVGSSCAGELSSSSGPPWIYRIVGRNDVRMQLLDYQRVRSQSIGFLLGLGICAATGCTRDIDYSVVPPLPPPLGETHST